ncbi:MAG: hypothetical protein AB7N91_06335 [Candidatus Tectimicrobiota bacterium]
MTRNGQTLTSPAPREHRIQQRHALAALVYFVYGLYYLFGAQYLTNMQQSQRGMGNPTLFFLLGGGVAVVFPLLIYSRFAIAFSLFWRAQTHRSTLFINFTLLLGLLVSLRVLVLAQGGLFLKTPWHTLALVLAIVNALCLLWAGLSHPCWITRDAGVGA